MIPISGSADTYHCSGLLLPLALLYQTTIMNIKIIEDDLLRNIQSDFQKQYPYLKLQFYKRVPTTGIYLPETDKLSLETPLEDATLFHCAAMIDIAPERTVEAVEEDFLRMLGLLVQVFRRSRNGWIQKQQEERLTLQRQNEKGREYSLPYGFITNEDHLPNQ
jgi:hypothetical protein